MQNFMIIDEVGSDKNKIVMAGWFYERWTEAGIAGGTFDIHYVGNLSSLCLCISRHSFHFRRRVGDPCDH